MRATDKIIIRGVIATLMMLTKKARRKTDKESLMKNAEALRWVLKGRK